MVLISTSLTLLALFCTYLTFSFWYTTTQLLPNGRRLCRRFLITAYRWLAVWTHYGSTRAQSLNVDFGVHDVHGVAGDCLLYTVTIPSALGTGAATYCRLFQGLSVGESMGPARHIWWLRLKVVRDFSRRFSTLRLSVANYWHCWWCVILQRVLDDAGLRARGWRHSLCAGRRAGGCGVCKHVASWMKAQKHETRALKKPRFVEGLWRNRKAF